MLCSLNGRKLVKIVSGNSNVKLAEQIAAHLDTRLVNTTIKRFADGECSVEIHENMRGEDVFVIQSTSAPANDHLLELLLTLDAIRRSSARRVTAVMPYFGYARQDRKSGPRTPISAKLVANLITQAGADRVLTVDLHAAQIQGFFDIPVDNLICAPQFAKHIRQSYQGRDVMIVSPDVGGVVRARNLASRVDAELAIIDKRRPRAGESQVMNIIGDVQGRDCILVDDIVDSGGTLMHAADALLREGALHVGVYVSHGVLSGEAASRICDSSIEWMTITNTIAATPTTCACANIRQLDVSGLIADAIDRIHNEKSVSSLFD
jgi:ribose-phosphate pyrophosphokinase